MRKARFSWYLLSAPQAEFKSALKKLIVGKEAYVKKGVDVVKKGIRVVDGAEWRLVNAMMLCKFVDFQMFSIN